MSFYAIGEPDYIASNWYRDIMDGLMMAKRRKRFALTVLTHPGELSSLVPTADDVIFVIGTNTKWLCEAIATCESSFGNRVIVLGNHKLCCDGAYSTVTADVAGNVRLLLSYLHANGKRRIAMYGVNPESASDAFRRESFLASGGCEQDLFFNSCSLARCFADFAPRCGEYDGVICVNDYAAISLIHHLEGGTVPFVVSCGGTALSGRMKPSVTHMRIRYDAFGRTGVELGRMLCADPTLRALHASLAGEFVAGESTQCIPLPPTVTAAIGQVSKKDDRFYADPEVEKMMRIEQLLAACDDDGLTLLSRLLGGQTYQQMAQEMFCSENGIKYKLKKMFRLCGVSSRAEFMRAFGKYL